jgi:hypothetical protein
MFIVFHPQYSTELSGSNTLSTVVQFFIKYLVQICISNARMYRLLIELKCVPQVNLPVIKLIFFWLNNNGLLRKLLQTLHGKHDFI